MYIKCIYKNVLVTFMAFFFKCVLKGNVFIASLFLTSKCHIPVLYVNKFVFLYVCICFAICDMNLEHFLVVSVIFPTQIHMKFYLSNIHSLEIKKDM